MELSILIAIAGVVLVVAVTTLAPRVRVAAPLLLVVLGIGISFLPFVDAVEIEPEWILAGILPPLLYSSAVGVKTMEFRRDLRVISAFSVVLVVVSAVVVGGLMSLLIPGLGWPLGIALGAIVSPTDAVATSIVKKAGISPRIVTILDGESLLNDATALVLLRFAVAAIGASVSVWWGAATFLYAVVVAGLIGFAVGHLSLFVRARVGFVTGNVLISLTIPYVAYLPAEALGASGLVAAVIAGLVAGNAGPRVLSAEVRVTTDAVWRTIELVLESAIFLVMGLELFGLVIEVTEQHFSVGAAFGIGALVATVVLAVRVVFVALSLWSLKRRAARLEQSRGVLDRMEARLADGILPALPDAGAGRPGDVPRSGPGAPLVGAVRRRRRLPTSAEQWERFQLMLARRRADLDYLASERLGPREGTLLVAAGMRGAVTLAAAQTLPHGTPYRSLLILVAFVVAAGTLLVQGGTLGPVARRLGLAGTAAPDPAAADAVRVELNKAAVARLNDPALRRPDGTPFSAGFLEASRRQWDKLREVRDRAAEADLQAEFADLRSIVLDAQRHELLRLRDIGSYPTGVLDDVLRQLDADQIGMQVRMGSGE
ncbi:cation:proton antiporter [Propionicicella superfundia]|uniref:cation:proton antiporter n=1 Tax=Propionicicella superfundia TaxID=348582 RepID=UPI00041CA206|nr:sodium:proton antiporter [Propionicicella superfundia]